MQGYYLTKAMNIGGKQYSKGQRVTAAVAFSARQIDPDSVTESKPSKTKEA